jgi:Fe-Mn family superoxide dismutase
MSKISRREALVGIAAISTLGLTQSPAAELRETAIAPAYAGDHKPKPLPFDPTKLNGISEKLIRSHWANNYTGAVNALNYVEKRLAETVQERGVPAYVYGQLKREELIRTGSVVLHELYFENLGGDGKPGGSALSAIKQWFGDHTAWEAEFRRTAASLSGGSGWTVLAYNTHTASLHNYWAADHSVNAPFSIPLLVLDMYEHAYQMDYGAEAAKYIDAFMRNVNWETVSMRVEKLRK